jgi:hypothetical protein
LFVSSRGVCFRGFHFHRFRTPTWDIGAFIDALESTGLWLSAPTEIIPMHAAEVALLFGRTRVDFEWSVPFGVFRGGLDFRWRLILDDTSLPKLY